MREKIKKTLAEFGGEWVDLPILLPSETVLELAGESLRSRLYFANSPNGQELCLRADLTIPSALQFLKNYDAKNGIINNLCSGKVFRANQNSNYDAHEFVQMGIEQYGAKSCPQSDIALFIAIDKAVKSARLQNYFYEFFDGALLKTLIQNANIDAIWRDYLIDGIGDIRLLNSRLNFAISANKPAPSSLAKNLVDLSLDEATKTIDEVLNIAKLKTFGIRGARAIAKRLQAKAKRAIIEPLNEDFKAKILQVLEINDAPFAAIERTKNIAAALNIDLSNWEKEWHSRFELIAKSGDILQNAKFITSKLGRFEYYDGFAFEILPQFESQKAFASGGRYDGLIGELSNGEINISAIGGVIRPTRILGASND